MFRTDAFEQHYNVYEEIGSGHFAVVRRCQNKTSGQEFAAKYIRKKRAHASRRGLSVEDIKREVSILTELNSHPNVISLEEVFDNNSNVILVLELVKGGELFDILLEKRCLMDKEASHFIHQILLGLDHLHQRHIAHLDLKPENIMVKDKVSQSIKIIDFGLARKLKGANLAREMMGTPEFVAPEIINFEPISLSTDLWSLGVITYILLSGASPFLGQTRQETFENIVKIDYSFDEEYFGHVSELGKDFICKLLVGDTRKRLGVKECLNHPWIKGPSPLRDSQFLPLLAITPSSNVSEYENNVVQDSPNNNLVLNGTLENNANVQQQNDLEHNDASNMAPKRNSSPILGKQGERYNSKNSEGLKRKFLWQRAVKLVSLCIKLFKLPPSPLTPFSLVRLGGGNNEEEDKDGRTANTKILKHLHILPSLCSPRFAHLPYALYPQLNRAMTITEASGSDTLFSAFLYACDSGNLLALQELLALTTLNLDERNDEGETGIHLAIKNGHIDIIKFLYAQAANFEITNNVGETPLFYAAKHGRSHIVDFLIQVGSNINAQNQNKETALHLAVNYAQYEVAEILCQKPSIALNTQDELGDSPLHLAVWHGLLNIVHLLCSNSSVDLNVRNMKGESPLHMAAAQGKMACLKRLIEAGADLDTQDKGNLYTPLHNAILRHHIPCALFLIDSGCAFDKADSQGNSPIHIACKEGLLPIVQALCAFGCKVNITNTAGMTPLHIASRYGRLEVCRCLCLACCDISLRVGSTFSSLDQAENAGNSIPRTAAAISTASSDGGLTASELAASHGHNRIADLLNRLANSDLVQGAAGDRSSVVTCPLTFSHATKSCKGHRKAPTYSKHADLVAQLLPSCGRTGEGEWLPCVKMKLLGASGSGKTRLVAALRTLPDRGGTALFDGNGGEREHRRRHSDRFTRHVDFFAGRRLRNQVKYVVNPGVSRVGDGKSSSPVQAISQRVTMTPKIGAERKPFYTFRQNSFSSLEESASSIFNNLIHGHPTFADLVPNFVHKQDPTTKGIEISKIIIPGAGPFSVWDFSGFRPYRQTYDHFIGSVNCAHLVFFNASHPLGEILRDVRYWLNFLSSRMCVEEPLGYCGTNAILAPVALVGTHADKFIASLQKTTHGVANNILSELESFKRQIFESVHAQFVTDLDLCGQIFLIDSSFKFTRGSNLMQNSSSLATYTNDELMDLIEYLEHTKLSLVQRLPRITDFLRVTLPALVSWRNMYQHCPVMPWPLFVEHIHDQVNCLASFDHLKELILQLQFMGEVLYIKWDAKKDMVVMDPVWLCSNVLGKLLNPHPGSIVAQANVTWDSQQDDTPIPKIPLFTIDNVACLFPDSDVIELLPVLEALQLCTQCQSENLADDLLFEFTCLGAVQTISLLNFNYKKSLDVETFFLPNFGVSSCQNDVIYGGYRILAQLPFVHSLLTDLFPRIQARFRYILQEHLDDGDNNLYQYATGSRLISGPLECLVNLSFPNEANDDILGPQNMTYPFGIDVVARGPNYMCSTLFYFLNDVIDIIDDVIALALPGLPTTKLIMDPQSLKEMFSSIADQTFYTMSKNNQACTKTYKAIDVWKSIHQKLFIHDKSQVSLSPDPLISSVPEDKVSFNVLNGTLENGSAKYLEHELISHIGDSNPLTAINQCISNVKIGTSPATAQHMHQQQAPFAPCLYTRLICFGSTDVRSNLTLSWDLPVLPHLSTHARKILCRALDPPEPLGRDWCLFALNLGLGSRIPDIDACDKSIEMATESHEKDLPCQIIPNESLDNGTSKYEQLPDFSTSLYRSFLHSDNSSIKSHQEHTNDTTGNSLSESPNAIVSKIKKHFKSKTLITLDEWINGSAEDFPNSSTQQKTLGTLVSILSGPCDRKDVAVQLINMLPLFSVTPRTPASCHSDGGVLNSLDSFSDQSFTFENHLKS